MAAHTLPNADTRPAIDGDISHYCTRPLPRPNSYGDAVAQQGSSSPRDQLRAANLAIEAALDEVEVARALSVKATRLLEAAQADFTRSQATSHELLAWKVDSFRKGSAEAIPPDLREARETSVFASENLEHSRVVANTIAAELHAAEAKVARAQTAKGEAVGEILTEAAEALTAELMAINELRHHLRLLLQGFGAGMTSKSHNTVRDVIESGLRDAEITLPMNQSPVTKAGLYWKSYAAALASDENVGPGAYPSWETLWS